MTEAGDEREIVSICILIQVCVAFSCEFPTRDNSEMSHILIE